MFRALSRRRTARTRNTSYRPHIDVLEQRAMLAADLGFTPLADSADTLAAGNTGGNAPYDLSEDFTQTVIQRRGTTAGADPDLGILLGQNTLNESGPQAGRFLFSTALETSNLDADGEILGTLNRTDLATGQTINLLDIAIAEGQDPTDDTDTLSSHLTLQNLRAIRWTPWGTLLVGEAIESGGTDAGGNDFSSDPDVASDHGLVYEIVNPASAQPVIFARPALGSGQIEGIDIDSAGNVYLDDNNGALSTVFRFVPDGAGVDSPLESGELQVLFVSDGTNFGDAEWVPLDGVTASFNVRDAVTDVSPNFTPYNIARDLEIGVADFGDDDLADETLYVTLQGDNQVIAVDLDGALGDTENPFVFNFVSDAVDSGFNDPVDIAVDAAGRVYIGEAIVPPPDASTPAAGNDVWVANDVADDIDDVSGVIDPLGSTDEFGRLASLRVSNASVAGLYINPFNNAQIYVNVSSDTATKNAIVRFDGGPNAANAPSVTETDVGNGEVIVTIIGTENSDRITITGNNLLTVRIGTQVFKRIAPSQNVIVYGLGGNDFITTSSGTFFDYTVFGGAGADYIATGRGDDSIAGEGGNDRLNGGTGENVISGGDGNDSLVGGRDNDVLSGDAGNDRLASNAGNDTLLGGDGNDVLTAGLGNDFADGGAGNDNIDAYFGDDLVIGGPGNDFLKGGSGQDVLIGGTGADRMLGGDGEDVLIGGTTAADDDEAALRGLAELWQMASFADDRAQQVLDYLDELDGDDDDDGVFNDTSRDLLDGNAGLDLFFVFGNQDRIQRLNPGDESVDLA